MFQYFHELTDSILFKIENWTKLRYYIPITVVVLSVWILLSSFPPYQEWRGETAVLTHRIQHPLTPIPDELRGSHEEKLAFRLTAPFIAYLLQLRGTNILLLENVFAILFLWAILLLGVQISGDKWIGVLVAWGFANIFTGKWGFYDMFFQFDSIGYCFLAFAMLRGFTGSTFWAVLLASFTDERALIASSLVFLWWRTLELYPQSISVYNFFSVKHKSMEVLLAWSGYFAIRYVLSELYQLKTGMTDVSLSIMLQNFKFIGILFWASYEFFFLLILLVTWLAIKQKNYTWGVLLWGGILLTHLIAMLVIDVSRSASYGFPAIFLSLYYLRHQVSAIEYRKLILWIALFCSIFPTLELFREIYWLSPIFPKILKYF